MGTEIERKFLIVNDDWRKNASPVLYRQGYLCAQLERTVRVRLAGEKAWLTIKGKSTGAARKEFEYEIDPGEAKYILDHLCLQPLIEKYRHTLEYASLIWVVDEFLGDNSGLIFAEIELDSVDQAINKPGWIGNEVTGDPKYFNANLINNPYKNW